MGKVIHRSMYDTNATEQLGHIHADFLVKDIGDNLNKLVNKNKFINRN